MRGMDSTLFWIMVFASHTTVSQSGLLPLSKFWVVFGGGGEHGDINSSYMILR